MKLLAIDTSTEVASVALLYDKEIICTEQPTPKTHAHCLLPMVDKVLLQAGVSLQQLNGIVYGCGPGSFTGLRIACSVAKGLACAHDVGLIPVGSLDAIAYAVREQKQFEKSPVLAVLDARMQQMYWGYYPAHVKFIEARVEGVQAIRVAEDRSFILAGLGIDLYWSDFTADVKKNTEARLTQHPHAAAMIRLALSEGIKPVEAARALPVYVRNQVIQGEAGG